eukprot:4220619-Pyramimonas_sp.AAC.2
MAAPADGADGAVDQAAAAAGQQDVDYDNKDKLLAPSRRALKAFDLKTAICSATRDMRPVDSRGAFPSTGSPGNRGFLFNVPGEPLRRVEGAECSHPGVHEGAAGAPGGADPRAREDHCRQARPDARSLARGQRFVFYSPLNSHPLPPTSHLASRTSNLWTCRRSPPTSNSNLPSLIRRLSLRPDFAFLTSPLAPS